MRVAAIVGHGGLDQIQLQDWPEPVAKAGEALIAVRACGLNYLDIFVRRGMPGLPITLPRISGGDISGVVKAVGTGVLESLVGTRVLVDPKLKTGGALGEHANGGLCEYLCVDADNLIPLSEEVSFEEAAALPIAYGTARRMLHERGNVREGELVLILGASGGVGTACVQLASNAGATVIACASTSEKLTRLAALGARHVINYSDTDFSAAAWEISNKRGVDVVINYTGGDTWVPSIRCLKIGGRLLTCGATAGFDPKEDLRYIWRREVAILGSNAWRRSDLEALLEDVAQDRLVPVIDRIFPLSETREAMRVIEDREVFGKVIVAP